MSKSPLPNILLGIVTVLALLSLGLCAMFQSRAQTLRELQFEATRLAQKQQVLSMLVNDAVEYGKTHPAIEPILQSVGIGKGAVTNPAAAVTPAPRPATK